MDQTYAEVANAYTQISKLSPTETTSRKYKQYPMQQNQLRRSRHLREQFDSRLPIEYRYPKKRNGVTSSSTTRHRSLWSKSSSSGYSSSGSVSSITTVVSGVEPYRPKKEEDCFKNEPVRERRVSSSEEKNEVKRVRNKEVIKEEKEQLVEVEKKSQACCIECREKEIRQELDLESHQYANIQAIKKPDDPYVFLMTSMLSSLQKDDDSRKVSKIQQKIEKVLRLKPREPFNVDNKLVFDRQISSFASDVTIRLQAVSEVAPEAYREISAKFCEALHQGAPNSTSLKSIMKGVKNLLTF